MFRLMSCGLLLMAAVNSSMVWAQESADGLWRALPLTDTARVQAQRNDALANEAAAGFVPNDYRLFEMAPEALSRVAGAAIAESVAWEKAAANADAESRISLPMPDGSFRRFEIIQSSVMSEELQKKFPEIRSYRGRCLDAPQTTMRLDLSPAGLHAQILSPQGTVIVDPAGESLYMSFNKRNNRAGAPRSRCLVEGGGPAVAARGAAPGVAVRSGDHLRIFRIAVACTGEYAAVFGGTKPDAMAAINTTINRVTGIYEREVGIRFVLVGNNDQLIYTDGTRDPFTNNNAGQLIYESQRIIDRDIGDADYDIGHTLSTGAGGLAAAGAGQTGRKALGVTGSNNPFGDPFDVDFVAHEIGHQFSADHTFNGTSGNCASSNRNGSTAVEPGSGTTILAYAGICGSDDVQPNSDDHFHSVSLDQIVSYVTVGGGNVVTPIPTGNGIPTVNAGPDYQIPAETPFTLQADGHDPDNDLLTYCWEQRDLGPAAGVSAPDDGAIPLFRSFSPTVNSHRTFPQWSDILSRTQTPGEQLPTRSRTMHMRVTVRDNRSGGGGVSSDDSQIHVHQDAGPFRVTHPSRMTHTSHLLDVQWDVADTDQPPVNCQQVNIRLSLDGGRTFSEMLSRQTPNDGQELVAIPANARHNLRVMVEASDNIFFAVNPSNFRIKASKTQVYLTRHAEKGTGDDPDLTPAGVNRARKLAEMMARLGVTHVFSTTANRTQQTAQAVANAVGVDVKDYSNPDEVAGFIAALPEGSRVLVVGHSDSVGKIAGKLGVTDTITIDEDDYSNLYFVGITDAEPQFQHFTYEPEPVVSPRPAPMAARGGDPGLNRAALTEGAPARRGLMQVAARAPSARSSVPNDRYAKSSQTVRYLGQNWSPEESLEFYGLHQGSLLLRKHFFDVLEQPDSSDLFRSSDYLSGFGLLPRRPHPGNIKGYPVGIVDGGTAIGLNCSLCHTSRLTYKGVEYRIDGSQAGTDFESFLTELVRALQLTLKDAPDLTGRDPGDRVTLDDATKFGRLARQLVGGTNPTVAQVRIIKRELRHDFERRRRYNDYNAYGKTFTNDADRDAATPHHPYGFARVDALGAILNQACAESIGQDDNAHVADAPVNYPAIWDAPQHTRVQWNGSVDNTALFGPLGRNAGQVIGVVGVVDTEEVLGGYDSSINFDALERAEELVTKLWSPLWPTEFPFDKDKAKRGETVYRANCVHCHSLFDDRTDPHRDPEDRLIPINNPYGLHGTLGTDPLTAANWQNRKSKLGLFAGRTRTLPTQGSFPGDPAALVPAREILTHLVFKTISRDFVPWRDELTIEDARRRTMSFAEARTADSLMVYKSRPLNGVWSTAPYLHNGSVLNMVELLTPPGDRKETFRMGTTEYDPHTLGYKDAGSYEFDARHDSSGNSIVPGNSNRGHAYGTTLTDEQKAELIEFLKTL